MMQSKLWVNGEWHDASGAPRSIINPVNEEVIAEIPDASAADVAKAVDVAETAFYDGRWSRLTAGERSLAIWKLADLLEQNLEEFAKAESENTGKPYEMLSLGGDLPFAVDNLRFFAAAARDAHGARSGEYQVGYTSIFRKDPVGVVGQIAPWNYPIMMAVWKLGPALAAGCTIVLKPAPSTPITTLMLAELTKEAGIPDGVINILPGGNETGQALVENPKVRMVSLTGSSATGKRIMQTASDSLKRVHLELGGKAPVLVFDDADIERLAEKATFGAIMNTGQDCTAATRVYVEKSRAKEATEALVEAMKNVKVGAPHDDGVEMGPMISAAQLERVQGFVERAKSAGAKVLTGGEAPGGYDKGYWYSPTVFSNVAQDSEIVQSEVFGPVITIQEFEGQEEAVRLGNDVTYGLAAAVFTKDVSRALKIARDLEFGTVWINDHLPLASEGPHGGFKQSGFGKDLSAEAVGDYQITKHIMVES
ncbi:MAG: aminobutyraldehyde dehydrogenase [Myxococcota bacterium]